MFLCYQFLFSSISPFVIHWRFVRREKEISETKCELSQSESIRYQQRCEYLEGQIQDLQKNISEQRTQSEVDSQTAAQHAKVMEKVQKLNELTETNKILTSEKESAEETVREMVTKVCLLQFYNSQWSSEVSINDVGDISVKVLLA